MSPDTFFSLMLVAAAFKPGYPVRHEIKNQYYQLGRFLQAISFGLSDPDMWFFHCIRKQPLIEKPGLRWLL